MINNHQYNSNLNTLKQFSDLNKVERYNIETSKNTYDFLMSNSLTFLPDWDKNLKQLVDKELNSKKLTLIQEQQKNILREKELFAPYSLMVLGVDNNEKLSKLIYPPVLEKHWSDLKLTDKEKEDLKVLQDYMISQIESHSLDYSFLEEDPKIKETIIKADKAYKSIQKNNKLNKLDENDNQVMLIYLRELFTAIYIENRLQEKSAKKWNNKLEKSTDFSWSADIDDILNESFFANKDIKCLKAPYWIDNQRGIDLILCAKAWNQIIVSLLDTKFRIQGAISELPQPRNVLNDQRNIIEKLIRENYHKDDLIVVSNKTTVVTMDAKKISDFVKNTISL